MEWKMVPQVGEYLCPKCKEATVLTKYSQRMTSQSIYDVRWLNNQDNKLFTIDNENFSLHYIDKNDENRDVAVPLYSIPLSTVSTTKQDHEYLRCFALDHSADNNVAFGFNNGRISISKIDTDSTTAKSFRGDDIRDIQKKSISCLAWHFYDNNKFCAAYERGRGVDHTVVVYDLSRGLKSVREFQNTTFETNLSEKIFGISWFKDDPNLIIISTPRCLRLADVRERNGFQTTVNVTTPHFGICTEPNDGFRVACHSRNAVSVFDRRFITIPIHEVLINNDIQSISKLTWHPNRAFHMSCVTKDSGIFYNLSISSNAYEGAFSSVEKYGATLETIKQTLECMSNEHKYAVLPYSIPDYYSTLYSFDWHPKFRNRLAVLCCNSGKTQQLSSKVVQIVEQVDAVSAVINCNEEIAMSAGAEVDIASRFTSLATSQPPTIAQSASESTKKQSQRFAELASFYELPDLGCLMKRRIANGYGYGSTSNGLATVIKKSRTAIDDDPMANDDLRFCWRWIDRMYHFDDIHKLERIETLFPGIKHIMRYDEEAKSQSSIRDDTVTFRNRIFTNEKRDYILRICGWPSFEDHSACRMMLDELMSRRTVRAKLRAAALAIFSVQGPTCKQYLQEISKFTASDSFREHNPGVLAEDYHRMVQSVVDVFTKFNGIKVPDYEQLCHDLTDSYLLAIVKFLARRESYNTINTEIMALKGIDLEDKLAFAAIHMDDENLNMALDMLLEELEMERRPLSSLLVTGLDDHPDCHNVLHKYIDSTSDIQTASILFVIGCCFRRSKMLREFSTVGMKVADLLSKAIDAEPTKSYRRRSLHCVRDYMELMNNWRFWLPKTFLASLLHVKTNFAEMEAQSRLRVAQAVVACNFCGSPVYPTVVERLDALRAASASSSMLIGKMGWGERTRLMSCAKCRKPLPKCTICRRHYGSHAEAVSGGNDSFPVTHSPIDHWFVWCCNCNHGGHLSHIRDWFHEYASCPASGCDCLCMDRDHRLRDELFQQHNGSGAKQPTVTAGGPANPTANMSSATTNGLIQHPKHYSSKSAALHNAV